MTAADLPPLNACLNGLATVLLISGIIAIKREAKQLHGMLMGATFVVSCVFLCSYLVHKIMVGGIHTSFAGQGIWRTIYYPMLATHVLLAMCVPVLAIITMRHALHGRYAAHRRWAKVTFPIWLYVSVTGVLVYFFLYQWFPAKP